MENTQRPVLVDAENAQQQLERSARNGGDEEKMQADHAKREVDEVKVQFSFLRFNLCGYTYGSCCNTSCEKAMNASHQM